MPTVTMALAARSPGDGLDYAAGGHSLRGNTEIPKGVATLEQRIIALEQAILAQVKTDGSAPGAGPTNQA